MRRSRASRQSGQVMILVAVVLIALIGATALILLAGSIEWQKNQLQELADTTALDASLKIGIGCDAAKAGVVILEADTFLANRRAPVGGLAIAAGTCATPYVGTAAFSGPIVATINYPYRSNQQQVEVILTLTLPISFGGVEGIKTTTVTRRALAQGPAASVAALSATTVDCRALNQVNVQGSVVTRNLNTLVGNCAMYAHARFDAASGTFSDLANVTVRATGQAWTGAGGLCVARNTVGARSALCADGYELTGISAPTCGVAGSTAFLWGADQVLNPNPCAAGVGPLAAFAPIAGQLSPEPNLDPNAWGTLRNAGGGLIGAQCVAAPGVPYPTIVVPGPISIGTGLGPVPTLDAPGGFYHFKPSCYGFLDISLLPTHKATFDPGFYYFNGSGPAPFTAGRAGVCMNKTGQLVGQDITMEFVGAATFNSGNCTGGAGTGGAFGSKPCSQPSCPPTVPADPPANAGRGLTWLAAPCSAPPDPKDANSCLGSNWCPVGNRACWNELIWAPATITGIFQVDSAGATAWLLGTISWPATCLWGPSSASAIAGAVSCITFRFASGTSSLATIGNDAGVNTALAEPLLVE